MEENKLKEIKQKATVENIKKGEVSCGILTNPEEIFKQIKVASNIELAFNAKMLSADMLKSSKKYKLFNTLEKICSAVAIFGPFVSFTVANPIIKFSVLGAQLLGLAGTIITGKFRMKHSRNFLNQSTVQLAILGEADNRIRENEDKVLFPSIFGEPEPSVEFLKASVSSVYKELEDL